MLQPLALYLASTSVRTGVVELDAMKTRRIAPNEPACPMNYLTFVYRALERRGYEAALLATKVTPLSGGTSKKS